MFGKTFLKLFKCSNVMQIIRLKYYKKKKKIKEKLVYLIN